MKAKHFVLAAVLVAFAIGQAGAGTVFMPLSDLPGNGWKVTTKNSAVDPRATVSEKTILGDNGFQFSPGKSAVNDLAWAGVSTGSFAGIKASQITSLKIKSYGNEGDGTTWQPPAFQFALQKAPTNASNRAAIWLPWDGETRLPGQWNEIDALTTGTWKIPWIGGTYTDFAAMLAAYPDLTFADDTVAATWLPSGQSFNVASGAAYNDMIQYFSSARGSVAWIEVGIDGNVTKYDFADVVPEPSSIVGLAAGMMGMLGVIRRRK